MNQSSILVVNEEIEFIFHKMCEFKAYEVLLLNCASSVCANSKIDGNVF